MVFPELPELSGEEDFDVIVGSEPELDPVFELEVEPDCEEVPFVGAEVGALVGSGVGAGVGAAVGTAVGTGVGTGVGTAVGAAVGS